MTKARTWVHERNRMILAGHALDVADRIRARILSSILTTAQRKSALEAATYLTNKAPHLDYPTALAKGWPIATGVIEDACRHLVNRGPPRDHRGTLGPGHRRSRPHPTSHQDHRRSRPLLALPPAAATPPRLPGQQDPNHTHPRSVITRRQLPRKDPHPSEPGRSLPGHRRPQQWPTPFLEAIRRPPLGAQQGFWSTSSLTSRRRDRPVPPLLCGRT